MKNFKTILAVVLILTTLTTQAGKKHKRKKVYTKCSGTCQAYK